jgi:hypothetical protein
VSTLPDTYGLAVLSKVLGQDFEHGNAQEQLEEQKEQAAEQT